MEFIIIIMLSLIIILLLILIFKKTPSVKENISDEINKSVKLFSETFTSSQNVMVNMQNARLKEFTDNQKNFQDLINETIRENNEKIRLLTNTNDDKLKEIRDTMESKIKQMQDDNSKKLDDMRNVVEEKLHKTLNERISDSFKTVSERLEAVYKSLGEMQNLAVNVGDLKRTLSNVKTRGIIGEVQLGSILEQILSKDQYVANVITKAGTQNFVEYAIKMPGNGDEPVYLPIDAKFPMDAYNNLVDAYEKNDSKLIDTASKVLETRIKSFAKDIKDKYIYPPNTTDFAIMFLPTEGLYAEIVKRDIFEYVQKEYNVVVAGPTNMAALLNSLQMGFRTLAIQKRSSEVWNVLGAVKTEFDKFAEVLESTQHKLDNVSSDLDKLVGVRTRQIQRKLKNVTYIEDSESKNLLEITDEE